MEKEEEEKIFFEVFLSLHFQISPKYTLNQL